MIEVRVLKVEFCIKLRDRRRTGKENPPKRLRLPGSRLLGCRRISGILSQKVERYHLKVFCESREP
jgi:hypothetical protein